MRTYAFSALLSSIFFFLGAVYLGSLSTQVHLRHRAAALFLLLSGFFLFTFIRTVTQDPNIAYASILILYAHAILLPPVFLDFITLYTSARTLRDWLLVPAYVFSIIMLGSLASGYLISGVSKHPYLSFQGIPGNGYSAYLAFVMTVTASSVLCLLSRFLKHPDFRTQANFLLILSVTVCLIAVFNTLFPILGLPHVPALTYAGYLVPFITIHALYRYGFLSRSHNSVPKRRSNVALLIAIVITIILIIYATNDSVSHSYSFLSSFLTSLVILIGGTLLIMAHPNFQTMIMKRIKLIEVAAHPHLNNELGNKDESDIVTLLSIINHDVRGVVAGLSIGISKLIRHSTVQEQNHIVTSLRKLEEDAVCLREMINGLENLFGPRALTQSARWHSLDKTITMIEAELKRRYTSHDFVIRRMRLPELFAAPELSYHVLRNLLDNCVKFSGEDKRTVIEIGCYASVSVLTLFVQDNGRGMKNRELDRVVRPFVKGKSSLSSTYTTKGQGIGLAIVSRLVNEMGWKFTLRSKDGEGTTASIAAPIHYFRFL